MTFPVSPHLETSFIGRERERRLVEGALSSGARIVTLTGPGGSGKSRLASVLARERAFGDAVTADVHDATSEIDVARRVLASFACATFEDDLVEQVGRVILARAPSLLVLDGCDRAPPAVRAVLDAWLPACEGLRVLLTARVPLDLPGEVVVDVAGLPIDGPGSAVELFEARAREARPERFTRPTSDDARCVRDIVTALDGLPLAIELAAPLLTVMELAELSTRLREQLRVLHDLGRRAERHASLRAVVRESFSHATADERAAVVTVSSFRGGFTVDAAARLLESRGVTSDGLTMLRTLRRAAFVRAFDETGPTRLALYAAVRELARESAAAEERDAADQAHATLFHHMAQDVLARVELGQRDAMAWFLAEEHNLLAAVETSARGSNADTPRACLARACTLYGLALVYQSRGVPPQLTEAISAEQRRAAPPGDDTAEDVDARVFAEAYARVCVAHCLVTPRGFSNIDWKRTRGVLRGAPEARRRAFEAHELHRTGRFEEAHACSSEAVTIASLVSEPLYVRTLALHAKTTFALNPTEGVALGREVVSRATMLPLDSVDRSVAMFFAFDQFVDAGHAAMLEGHLRDSLAIAQRDGRLRFEAVCSALLVVVDIERNARAAAQSRYEACIATEAGRRYLGAGVAPLAGLVVIARCDWTAVRRLLEAELRVPITKRRLLAQALLSATLAITTRADEARMLLAGLAAEAPLPHGDEEAVRVFAMALAAFALDPTDDALRAASDHGTKVLSLAPKSVVARQAAVALGGLYEAFGVSFRPTQRAGFVTSDGRLGRTATGNTIDLTEYPLLARLLLTLIDARLDHGEAGVVSLDALLAVGWPGESMRYDSALQRLRTAISRLRGRGLDDDVETVEGGYRLVRDFVRLPADLTPGLLQRALGGSSGQKRAKPKGSQAATARRARR